MEKNKIKGNGIGYTQHQIRRMIQRYQELRNLAEIASVSLEDESIVDFVKCKEFEQIICTLVDVDHSIEMLTPRQQEVVTFVKEGYSHEMISRKLNLSITTIKFHFRKAILKISTYQNYGQQVRIKS
jgi:DNA-binding NarL/FixJ family response regulator